MHNLTYKPGLIEYYETPEPTREQTTTSHGWTIETANTFEKRYKEWLATKKTVKVREEDDKPMLDMIIKSLALEDYNMTDFIKGISINSLADRIEIVDGEARLKPAKEQNEAVEFPSDEDILQESLNRFGETKKGTYHAARPHEMKIFKKGAEWMRDKIQEQFKNRKHE